MLPKLIFTAENWAPEHREEAERVLGRYFILNKNEDIWVYPRNFNCHIESYIGCENCRAQLLDYGYADTEAAIAGAFAAADKNTPIPEELTNDVTRFFSMDFMEVLNKFHKQFEV